MSVEVAIVCVVLFMTSQSEEERECRFICS